MPDPKRTARWIFDLAVVAALISSVVMITMGRWEPAIRFGVVALIMLIARFGDVPPSFGGAFAVLLLFATWASVEHWYRQINNFDLLVHFLTPGSLAAVAYFVLARLHLLPPVGKSSGTLSAGAPVVWVTVVGVTAAVLWEFYEWVVEQIAPAGMRVGYTDTIGDLIAGMAGSIVAGLLVTWWGAHRRPGAG